MMNTIDRRNFLQLGLTAGAAATVSSTEERIDASRSPDGRAG